jgi:N,N'-diacetylbacillosaminyl-diphospho-undecaprenol alpha-1,3-N-acetylgalactosaminyltransferase
MYLSYIGPSRVKLLIHAGVDLGFFAPDSSGIAVRRLRSSLGLVGCTVVTFIGRLIIHKGVRELLQAWTQVERSHPNARLLIIGEADPGNPSSASVLAGPVPQSVVFLGRRDDVRDLLSITDVVVNPSHREGMSRVNMEALASAKPIVTTDAPGCAEMVDNGVNGVLVPIADTTALATALDMLLSDPCLRKSMGRASLLKAVEFSMDCAGEKLRLFYREALMGSRLIGSGTT